MTPFHVFVTWQGHCKCLDTKWLSRDKQFNCTFEQNKAGIVPHVYIKFKKSLYNNKNYTRSVFCSTRAPLEITKAETLRPLDSGFLHGDFFEGSGWTEYLTRFFYYWNSPSEVLVPCFNLFCLWNDLYHVIFPNFTLFCLWNDLYMYVLGRIVINDYVISNDWIARQVTIKSFICLYIYLSKEQMPFGFLQIHHYSAKHRKQQQYHFG